MSYVQTLFTPIVATVDILPADFRAGMEITIDTNVPGVVLYTTDGSAPIDGEFGTTKVAAPATITIKTTTTLKYKVFDNRDGQDFNQSKTETLQYTATRNNPVEEFKDNKHFFRELYNSIVDKNFYIGDDDWVVPASIRQYTYLYRNNEGYRTRVRLLQNGIDALNNQFPILNGTDTVEFTMNVISGENNIEIQTEKV